MVNNLNFKVLDGLRGIAALYVVINHSRAKLHIGGSEYAQEVSISDWSFIEKAYFSALQLTSVGREFVIFFFVLSGFSIAFSLNHNSSTFQFWKKRLIRLYPPYILAILWAGFVFYFIDYENGISVLNSFSVFIKNLFYIPTGSLIAQFWSLPHEVIFYLIIPFLFIKIRFYYTFSVFFWLISFIISWNNIAGSNLLTKFLFDYNIFFAVGVYLYRNYSYFQQKLVLKKTLLIIVTISTFLLMVAINFTLGDYSKINQAISSFFSILLLVNFLHFNITNRLIEFLGKMSYTLYITHWASIFLFKYLLQNFGVIESGPVKTYWIWYFGIVFCVMISYVFYFMVEARTKNLLNIIRKKE